MTQFRSHLTNTCVRDDIPPMATKGKAWWHTQFSNYCAWLPGDERGFRNRDHRIDSGGDYKNPPPPEEHEGLRRYYKNRHP